MLFRILLSQPWKAVGPYGVIMPYGTAHMAVRAVRAEYLELLGRYRSNTEPVHLHRSGE